MTTVATASSNKNYRIVSIEGNIGSGKSTLLRHLKTRYASSTRLLWLSEPVDDWETIRSADGQTMLQKFYADQSKYSFPFQIMAYISRLQKFKEAVDACRAQPETQFVILTERSLYTDKHVFAHMLYDQGCMEDVCYQIYLRWFNLFADEYRPDRVVYVKTDPEVCLQRIHLRLREGESGIPLAYLQDCHAYHERMVQGPLSDCHIKVLDGNEHIPEGDYDAHPWLVQLAPLLLP